MGLWKGEFFSTVEGSRQSEDDLHFGLVPKLPAEVENGSNRNHNVRDNNVGSLPWAEERSVPLEEGEHDVEDKNRPSAVREQPCTKGQLVHGMPLMSPSTAEANVAKANACKYQKGRHTADIDDVGKDLTRARADGQQRDQRNNIGQDEGWYWDLAPFGGPAEDLGCSAGGTEGMQCSGGKIQ